MSTNDEFLTADHEYAPNQVVLKLGGSQTNAFNPRRIQVSDLVYILPPKMIYHACDPNAYIDWQDMTLRALRDILQNEIVTYHYGTSEYDYTVGAFQCDCGSKNCVGFFSGFKDMKLALQLHIVGNASEYIRGRWKTQV